jgi:uncharacterized C2H2 Zn-finger protein
MARWRYRCPYCGRAFKHAGSLQKHKNLPGARRGWCVASPEAALAANKRRV